MNDQDTRILPLTCVSTSSQSKPKEITLSSTSSSLLKIYEFPYYPGIEVKSIVLFMDFKGYNLLATTVWVFYVYDDCFIYLFRTITCCFKINRSKFCIVWWKLKTIVIITNFKMFYDIYNEFSSSLNAWIHIRYILFCTTTNHHPCTVTMKTFVPNALNVTKLTIAISLILWRFMSECNQCMSCQAKIHVFLCSVQLCSHCMAWLIIFLIAYDAVAIGYNQPNPTSGPSPEDGFTTRWWLWQMCATCNKLTCYKARVWILCTNV